MTQLELPTTTDRRIDVEEAGANFDRLLDDVEAGTTISLTRHGRAIARLVPHRRVLGRDAGLFAVPDEFDGPAPEIVSAFDGPTG